MVYTELPQTSQKPFELITVEPVYGLNYNKGYIGFTYNGKHPVGRGIAYFTRKDQISRIHTTHVLIVTGEDSCIEADAASNCVKENDLEHYFKPSNTQIFFRKPLGLTEDIANRIVERAKEKLGKEYDFHLILSHLLSGTLLGHSLDRLSGGNLKELICQILDNPNEYICSELAAYALDQQPEYKDKGILSTPNAAINPQQLFEDVPDVQGQHIFEEWHQDLNPKFQHLVTSTTEDQIPD